SAYLQPRGRSWPGRGRRRCARGRAAPPRGRSPTAKSRFCASPNPPPEGWNMRPGAPSEQPPAAWGTDDGTHDARCLEEFQSVDRNLIQVNRKGLNFGQETPRQPAWKASKNALV